MKHLLSPVLAAAALGLVLQPALAGAEPAQLRERAQGRLMERLRDRQAEPSRSIDLQAILPGSRVRTERYGTNAAQTLDVYSPPNATNAPVLVMVHGGAWKVGDKARDAVVENKLRYWLPRGFIVVSVNYRLLPEAMADAQAGDVADAVRWVSDHGGHLGADRDRIVLMGHSAGAHLVGLLASSPDRIGRPVAGAVILDSAALDVAAVMARRHPGFYDEAFGANPEDWRKASPAAQWSPAALPMMLVCSTRRPDDPCGEARSFARLTAAAGRDTPVLPLPLSHGDINSTLGLPGDYTRQVDAFIMSALGGQ